MDVGRRVELTVGLLFVVRVFGLVLVGLFCGCWLFVLLCLVLILRLVFLVWFELLCLFFCGGVSRQFGCCGFVLGVLFGVVLCCLCV